MSHAEQCPVCLGSGRYKKKKCHGCDGKGWVVVQDQDPVYIPYIPYREPYRKPYRTRPYEVWYGDNTVPIKSPAIDIDF